MVQAKALNIILALFFLLTVSAAAENRYDIPIEGSPSWGPEDAPVMMIEFIDYQWPHCNAVGPTVKKIIEDYEGKIRFVIKNYPYKYL